MDLSLFVNQRLRELGLRQKDLARAADVTESYISQLLTRKKSPPAPGRTDIYQKMESCLKLPVGELARLVDLQRRSELKRQLDRVPEPLFVEVRALVVRKCSPAKRQVVQGIFESQPFGELERLVVQKMLEVTRPIAQEELDNDRWLRMMARRSRRSFEEMRVVVLEYLDTEGSAVSVESSVAFLDPLIKSWDVDLETLDLEIHLSHGPRSRRVKRFAFVGVDEAKPPAREPGLSQFLRDAALSESVTEEEIVFLESLRFRGEKRPTALYYYRELQNLRDPLHFRVA